MFNSTFKYIYYNTFMKHTTHSEQELENRVKAVQLRTTTATPEAGEIVVRVRDIVEIIQSEREKSFASEKLRLCEVLEDLLHYQYSLPADNSDGFKNVVPSKVIQMKLKLAKLVQKEESK